jgi:hypothetical protein
MTRHLIGATLDFDLYDPQHDRWILHRYYRNLYSNAVKGGVAVL